MIAWIARKAVRNPVAVNLGTIALIVSGLVVGSSMPREVFPVFSMQTVEILTFYPGASPEDTERLVTIPIENELAFIDGLDEITSSSKEGLSAVVLKTGRGTEMSRFLADVRAGLQSGELELPEEAEEPAVREVESEFPVISVYVYGWPEEEELRRVAEEHQLALEKISGVRRVEIAGIREPRIWVEVLPEALERYGLTLDDVGRAVGARSRDLPLASLERGVSDRLLRIESGVQRAADLSETVVVRGPDGTRVPLREIARLIDTHERPITRSRFNGKPSIHLQVKKREDGDAIDIATEVKEYVAREQAEMPAGTALGVNTDLSIYVENRLAVMRQSGAIGAVLVMISLVLFLSLRAALMTAIGIPISFIGGILIAGLFGISMNMMTMFALIVVLGMIVDDAIVVGENVFRLMEEGMDPEEAAVRGTAEVGVPVMATILTTCAAFLPILLLGGLIGEFMRPIPLVVTFCLVVSMVEAFCVLPSHLAHWGASRRRRAKPKGRKGRWYDPLHRLYLSALRSALRWRYVVVAGACALGLLSGGYSLLWVPFNLFDEFESKIVYVNLRMPAGTTLDESERIAVEVERRMLAMPREDIDTVNVLVGVVADDASRWELGQNLAQLWIDLNEGPDRKQSTAQIIADIRAQLIDLPGEIESVEVAQPQSGPTGRAIDVWVRGPELAVLEELADGLVIELESHAGVLEAYHDLQLGMPGWVVHVNEEARLLGVDETWLAGELRAGLEGARFGRVRRGRDDVEITIKLPEELRSDEAALDELRVSLPGGGRVPLSTLAELRPMVGPATISRDDRERAVNITADVDKEEVSAGVVAAALSRRFAELAVAHPDYQLAFKGDQKEMDESLAGVKSAMALALALIFLILGSLFRSVLQPFVIMFVIPFATIGMVLGHIIMDRTIGLMSLVGLLALTGVIVNDSLILCDFANVRRRAGAKLFEALMDAGRLRFRPILLTSVTTMLGLLPLTFFASGQSRFLQPMAISLFFGLGFGTLLVLFLVPCSYAILEDGIAFAKQPRRVFKLLRRDRPVHAA